MTDMVGYICKNILVRAYVLDLWFEGDSNLIIHSLEPGYEMGFKYLKLFKTTHSNVNFQYQSTPLELSIAALTIIRRKDHKKIRVVVRIF